MVSLLEVKHSAHEVAQKELTLAKLTQPMAKL